MKKFAFPLERVRQYRKLQLETEQAKLEQCFARLRSVESMEAELQRQQRESAEAIRTTTQSGRDLESYGNYRGYASRVALMLEHRRAEALRAIEQQRLATLAARQRYEALNHYHDRAKAMWLEDYFREQENLAGELFLAKWAARNPRTRAATR